MPESERSCAFGRYAAMLSVGLFLAALGRRWWALLSSAVFTMIGLYALITGKSNHWIVAVSIAVGVILFLFASFGAWKEQYDARIAAERLNDESKKTKEIRLKLAPEMGQSDLVLFHFLLAPK